jgi:hypothetical protein
MNRESGGTASPYRLHISAEGADKPLFLDHIQFGCARARSGQFGLVPLVWRFFRKERWKMNTKDFKK